MKGVLRFGGERDRLGREDPVGGTEGPNGQLSTAQTPESGAQRESEQSTKKLLAAYQGMLDVVEVLPAIVWLRWGEKGLWRFLKIPYLR